MANDDIRDVLIGAAAAGNKGAAAPAPDAAAGPAEDNDLIDDLSRELETLRGPTTPAERATMERSQQHTQSNSDEGRFDELSYQDHRAQSELSAQSAELVALDHLIQLDRMRLEELTTSMQSKIAARARTQHLHDANVAFIQSLRGTRN